MKLPTLDRLREVLHYDPETGVFTWRICLSNRAPVGSIAGKKPCSTGHHHITIDSSTHILASRLAWFYMTGEWSKVQIDHKDRNKSNNRFANLREATNAQNNQNKGKLRTNTSGWKGVHTNTNGRTWVAEIWHNNQKIYIGSFKRSIDAALAYGFKALALHGEFARLA